MRRHAWALGVFVSALPPSAAQRMHGRHRRGLWAPLPVPHIQEKRGPQHPCRGAQDPGAVSGSLRIRGPCEGRSGSGPPDRVPQDPGRRGGCLSIRGFW